MLLNYQFVVGLDRLTDYDHKPTVNRRETEMSRSCCVISSGACNKFFASTLQKIEEALNFLIPDTLAYNWVPMQSPL